MLAAVDIPESRANRRAVALQNRKQICRVAAPIVSCSGTHASISHDLKQICREFVPCRASHIPHQVTVIASWSEWNRPRHASRFCKEAVSKAVGVYASMGAKFLSPMEGMQVCYRSAVQDASS
jgi:hypothetical protein